MKETLIYLGGSMLMMGIGLVIHHFRINHLEKTLGKIAIDMATAMMMLSQDVEVLKSHRTVTPDPLDKTLNS